MSGQTQGPTTQSTIPTGPPTTNTQAAMRTPDSTDQFFQTMFDDIARMRTPNIASHTYSYCADRVARLAQNLFVNWVHIQHNINEFANAKVEHAELEARTETLIEIYFWIRWDITRRNGFKCSDKVAKMRDLLERLRCDVETEEVSIHD